MAVVLSTGRQRLGRELALVLIIPNADITAISATSITAANTLRNSLWGATKFSDMQAVIFRPGAASAADYIRFAGDLAPTTGVLSHTGANYTDTTVGTEHIEIWFWGVRPDREIVDSLNRVAEMEFTTSLHMLSLGSRNDFGMESATDTSWTDVGTPTTSAKTALGTQTAPYGPRAYRLANALANEGTRSASFRVTKARQVNAFAIVAADVGTASFQLRDVTNSADIGTAVTHSERTPLLVAIRNQTTPATCESVALSMLGQEATADIYWNQVGLYKLDDLFLPLPSFVAEAFMVQAVYQAVPRTQIASNVWDAGSLDFVPLVQGSDFWITVNHGDATPYKLRFRDASLFDWPIFVEYKRPVSDLTTFAADDTASVPVAVHNLLPRWKMDVLETIYNGAAAPRHPDWAFQYDLAKKQLISAQSVRRETRVGRTRPYFAGVSRM